MATLGAPLATDTVVPPGRSASNRNWKEANAKASKRVQSKTLHAGYHKRAQKERTIKQMKTIEKEMKDEKAVQVEAAKLRMKERKQQKLENEKKNEVVQLITSASKLKRLKKKQLRGIQKR